MVTKDSSSPQGTRARWPWIVGAVCWLILLISLLLQRGDERTATDSVNRKTETSGANASADASAMSHRRGPAGKSVLSAEQLVASKVRQFGRSRREFVYALARRANKEVPNEVDEFFNAIEEGDWDKIDALFKGFASRSGQYEGSTHAPELDEIWPAILDAYGVAEQAHLWPAQQLLDYGKSILDSLSPGMVYVGGTDPGRWIPALLNDTSDGARHIVVTQNAFADKRYLDYMEFQFSDRFATLTHADSERAFADYVADAQKRFEHDQQFPNEPKQIREGEKVGIVDGKFQVSGQVSVMAINEKLFQMMLEKNPDLSFAMEESFPFKSIFAEASPLGPIMELRVRDEERALTPERAAQTVGYWKNATQQLLHDSEASSDAVRKTYSKLLSSQAGLFLDRNHAAEAETLFRMANEVCPTSPEAVFRYVNLLVDQNRLNETFPVVQNALRAEPKNKQFLDLLAELNKKKAN